MLVSVKSPSPPVPMFLNVSSCFAPRCFYSGNQSRKGSWARRFFVLAFAAMTEGSRDISQLLIAWNEGDGEALHHLMSCVYPELRRIARQHLGRFPVGHTLES